MLDYIRIAVLAMLAGTFSALAYSQTIQPALLAAPRLAERPKHSCAPSNEARDLGFETLVLMHSSAQATRVTFEELASIAKARCEKLGGPSASVNGDSILQGYVTKATAISIRLCNFQGKCQLSDDLMQEVMAELKQSIMRGNVEHDRLKK